MTEKDLELEKIEKLVGDIYYNALGTSKTRGDIHKEIAQAILTWHKQEQVKLLESIKSDKSRYQTPLHYRLQKEIDKLKGSE